MTDRYSCVPSLGWAVLRQGRVLIVLFVVSVLSLVGGVFVAQVLVPARQVREPVRPGLITAKLEARELRSTVVARADVSFADPVEVMPGVPEGTTRPVVTGRVPKVGGVVRPGDVVLEVSGRPVFALAGKFPAYRSLAAGMKGPDVTMLRAALTELGYPAGGKSSTYDAALAGAVAELYADRGYSAPGSDDRAKRDAVRDAEDAVTDAQAELRSVQAALKNATKNPASTIPGEEPVPLTSEGKAVLKTAATSAKRALTRAQEALKAAREDALTPFPSAEAVFLTAMPRRVDAVYVRLGGVVGESASASGIETNGAALVLSGNAITVVAQVPLSEATLITTDDPVELIGPGGVTVPASVASVCPEADRAGTDSDPTGRCAVAIALGEFGDVDRLELLGNVQATIQVGATAPGSLAVPVGAVSADAAGRARVQRVGDPAGGAAVGSATEWVMIEPGLSAEGFVEVTSSIPRLSAGDLVVLGVADGGSDTDDPGQVR